MWGRGWGGVGHVNVPCTLHTLLMFRTCQDVRQGLGWGMLTFLVRCTRCWCSATARMWGRGWGGVGHVLQRSSKWKLCVTNANNLPARLLKKLPLVLVWQAQMIDRAWRSLKFEWLPAHINATQKKDGHSVLSPIVSELVFQWAWRQHQGPMSPTQSFTALQRLLKHWKKWDETKIRRCSLQEVLMNKRQCELQKVTEMPRPSVRRVPSYSCSVAQCN